MFEGYAERDERPTNVQRLGIDPGLDEFKAFLRGLQFAAGTVDAEAMDEFSLLLGDLQVEAEAREAQEAEAPKSKGKKKGRG